MAEPSLISNLRRRRADAGLSQSELASRVGVSRQALVAIEAGRQVPSTALALQLARVLGCRVESLFALPAGPQLVAAWAGRSVPRTRRLAVGRVDGRWVAHAHEGDDRPADGLVAGDWPVAGTDAGIDTVMVEPLADVAILEQNVLVAGCAPLLGILAERMGRRYHDARATWISANSSEALDLLERGLVHVAGIHLAGAAEPRAHVRAAQRIGRASLINLARWKQGLVVARDNPLGIDAGEALVRQDLRWVMREPGAGAQKVLESALREAGQDLVAGVALASDHREVARLVRWGVADAGVAIESVALAEDLHFIPLSEERFDLIVPESRLDVPAVARFLDLIDRPAFRSEAAGLPGYDLSLAGQVSTVA